MVDNYLNFSKDFYIDKMKVREIGFEPMQALSYLILRTSLIGISPKLPTTSQYPNVEGKIYKHTFPR